MMIPSLLQLNVNLYWQYKHEKDALYNTNSINLKPNEKTKSVTGNVRLSVDRIRWYELNWIEWNGMNFDAWIEEWILMHARMNLY